MSDLEDLDEETAAARALTLMVFRTLAEIVDNEGADPVARWQTILERIEILRGVSLDQITRSRTAPTWPP
jgi:hypothetical protein